MKITFFSNFLSHHQLPFCLAMDRLTNGQFTFVATTPVPQERLRMGYHDMNKQYPFVLTVYDSAEKEQFAQELAVKSDVVIIGSAPDRYMVQRLKQNKLTFKYSERLYKQGLSFKRIPRAIVSAWLHHGRFMKRTLYMLCASAYTAADCAKFGNYLGRTYKWGYFPEVKRQNVEEVIEYKRNNSKVSILWAGRMIGWKHPDDAISLAEKLKRQGYGFELNLIGNGEMEEQLQNMIRVRDLSDCVHMLGAMSPEAVREHMEAADIFLFTSDFNEGWGAVLNEAMNSACAVVASHAIGSVPFLVKDGKNGCVYRNGDVDSLYECVVKLIERPELREQMGKEAYRVLTELWNAEVAAERLILLSKALLVDEEANLFDDGPCSQAKILRNWWYS